MLANAMHLNLSGTHQDKEIQRIPLPNLVPLDDLFPVKSVTPPAGDGAN